MVQDQTGAIIESGPDEWQIAQQDEHGLGRFALRGRWAGDTPGKVELRLVYEDTGVPVNTALDWHQAATRDDHTWSAVLDSVPAGGLYRLETRFNPEGNIAGEWSTRGDMRHFLGVGDLWVIAGQSNSAGYGRGPVHDPPELGVHLFRNSEQWALATNPMNESTDTQHVVNREAANSGHSPYLHFGRLLKQQLGYPIGLVQTALGGSALAAWNPTESKSAVLFNNMVHSVERAGGCVKGVLWYQGETDANEKDGTTYAERFINAVGAWREALHNPGMPVLTVQLNRVFQTPTDEAQRGWSLVREAQRQVPARLEGVSVVPAIDLPLSDGIHISPAGNLLLADRLARAALGMVYGRLVDYRAPNIQSARLADDRTIELAFTSVTSRMDNIDPTANSFLVEDKAGAVPVDKVVYPGDTTIRLSMGRAVSGAGCVHGGFGINPATLPVDMERLIPMLCFHAFTLAS
jgi:hypothetical protein